MSGKKTVCVLNKSDLYPREMIEKKQRRLQGYMEEAKIQASMFVVSLKGEKETEGLEGLRCYIMKGK